MDEPKHTTEMEDNLLEVPVEADEDDVDPEDRELMDQEFAERMGTMAAFAQVIGNVLNREADKDGDESSFDIHIVEGGDAIEVSFAYADAMVTLRFTAESIFATVPAEFTQRLRDMAAATRKLASW